MCKNRKYSAVKRLGAAETETIQLRASRIQSNLVDIFGTTFPPEMSALRGEVSAYGKVKICSARTPFWSTIGTKGLRHEDFEDFWSKLS